MHQPFHETSRFRFGTQLNIHEGKKREEFFAAKERCVNNYASPAEIVVPSALHGSVTREKNMLRNVIMPMHPLAIMHLQIYSGVTMPPPRPREKKCDGANGTLKKSLRSNDLSTIFDKRKKPRTMLHKKMPKAKQT